MKLARAAAALLGTALTASPALCMEAEERARVLSELEALKGRIAELEALLADETAETAADANAPVTKDPPADRDGIGFGGAVRLNYGWKDYDDASKDRAGDFELELVRINFDGEIGGVGLSAEHRWYNGFEAIHHAYFEWPVRDDGFRAQLGITQVPFGILPWASHSYWFGGTYYMGFEDDYDTGLKFLWNGGPWEAQLAFYKNPEYADDSRYGRYSFDVVTGGDQQNSEINQWNARLARRVEHAGGQTTLGGSLQYGALYNRTTGRDGDRWALAVHADSRLGPWNLQAQYIRYDYSPENPAGVSDDTIQMGGFDFPFLMAAEGEVVSLNLARALDVEFGPVTGITCYNDLTHISPRAGWQRESIQNVTGCSISAGGLYTYVDWIAGKNMWFSGGPGIGLDDNRWRSRLNVNLGYYF